MAGGAGRGATNGQAPNIPALGTNQSANGSIAQQRMAFEAANTDPAELAARRQSSIRMATGMPALDPAQAPAQSMAQAPAQMPMQAQPMSLQQFQNARPAISPMQQYIQNLGINRMGFNPQAYANPGYAAPRAPQVFQPQLRPSAQPAAAAAPQKSEMDKMREELDSLRAWREQQQNPGGNGNSN